MLFFAAITHSCHV